MTTSRISAKTASLVDAWYAEGPDWGDLLWPHVDDLTVPALTSVFVHELHDSDSVSRTGPVGTDSPCDLPKRDLYTESTTPTTKTVTTYLMNHRTAETPHLTVDYERGRRVESVDLKETT